MSDPKLQKIVDTAYTAKIGLQDGSTVTVMRDGKTISVAHNEAMLSWPAPVAFLTGRLLMHMALQIDPSLKDTLGKGS